MGPGPISRFFRYDRLLAQELAQGCASLLDVGCGSNSPVRRLTAAIPQRTGVDAFGPALEASLAAGIHTDGRQVDVLDIGRHFGDRSYDCVLASDVIEHLDKEDGLKLLAAMERIARHKVVVFSPTAFCRRRRTRITRGRPTGPGGPPRRCAEGVTGWSG